ncbi:MAG: F0F1 ATP synthase subunit alpha, partial [Deltaproteobacteria bacterium]|nr:F0F1 ATP synthase subunit alpha [Deltaproteobacteria bacterium]
QVLIIYAATNGFIDSYPVESLKRYEEELNSFFESRHPGIISEIREKKNLDADLKAKVNKALEELKGIFSVEAK